MTDRRYPPIRKAFRRTRRPRVQTVRYFIFIARGHFTAVPNEIVERPSYTEPFFLATLRCHYESRRWKARFQDESPLGSGSTIRFGGVAVRLAGQAKPSRPRYRKVHRVAFAIGVFDPDAVCARQVVRNGEYERLLNPAPAAGVGRASDPYG
jgi:hypothetical protein